MTIFDGFMAVTGLFCYAVIIFWIVGKLRPEIREEEVTEWLYDFLFNTDIQVDDAEVYEQD